MPRKRPRKKAPPVKDVSALFHRVGPNGIETLEEWPQGEPIFLLVGEGTLSGEALLDALIDVGRDALSLKHHTARRQ